MPKEAVLTSSDKESMVIENFIFHIIIAGEETPRYLDLIELTEDQRNFFAERARDASKGTQYVFVDKENNNMYNQIKKIISNPSAEFLPVSKNLAQDFLRFHKGNVNDGVFVLFLVKVSENTPLLILLKIDHKRVLHYTVEGAIAKMEEIIDTFTEDPKAIQKGAIIDFSETYQWDVLAFERGHTDIIAQYFKSFLSVTEREDDIKLTRKVVTAVRNWATSNQEVMDRYKDSSGFKSRAIDYVSSHDLFDTEEFIRMVVNDEDELQRRKASKSLREYLEIEGIAGQVFRPKPNALTRTQKRNIRRTAEGVSIEWNGDANAHGITLPSQKADDGMYHIVIKTTKVENLS